MLADDEVEVTGVFEPDAEQRIQLEQAGEKPWSEVNWYDDPSEFLDDPTITAVASEGSNSESLDHTDAIIDAGKHAFYDKPAGDDYARFESIVARAKEKSLLIQMGYMFRYHDGFERILSWAIQGFSDTCFRYERTSRPASQTNTGLRSPSSRAASSTTWPAT